MTRMTPEQAQHVLHDNITPPEPGSMTYYAESFRALETLAADTLEYGVARPDDEGWGIWWDDQRMQDWGTLDEARENLARVKRHCPDARLVCRRVSAPWEVTDE